MNRSRAIGHGVPTAILDALQDDGVDCLVHLHPPVHTVEEAREYWAHIAGAHAKNLFLKDAGGRLWLVVAPSESRVDLKRLPRIIGSKRLSFGAADLLAEVLGVSPGSVSPLAAMNDKQGRVTVALDASLMKAEIVNVHPLVNVATIGLTPGELVGFLTKRGHAPLVVDLAT
ncbi:MAG: prolyl-tRNA synthetase associated domain-containing protein [Hyphomicrobiales bacterium]|nr:prolyl-tRNA synthetase associated domain-containing protein [Hyphomicrobiales bacterium]